MEKVIHLFIAAILLNTLPAFGYQKINIAISSAPNNLIPFYSTDANSQNINRLVHMSLIDFNKKMKFECKACLNFKQKMIGAKQVVSFELRKDLFFSDGTAVSSQDVSRSWQYFAKNKSINSTFMSAFEAIEKIVIHSPYKFDIIYSHFSLENISNLGLLKIIKIPKADLSLLAPTDLLGCGDYSFQSVSPLEIIISPRNKSKPHLVFKVVKDETTLALKLINREIDLSIASMSPRKINWLKKKADLLKVWDIPSSNYIFMGLNHKRDIFKNIKTRKAISLLIPRKDILEYKLKNTALLSNGMFSPAFEEMYSPRPIEGHDIQSARRLLFEAGFRKNAKGFLVKDAKEVVLDWKVSNNKSSIEIVEVIQNALEKEGFKINVTVQEWGTYMNSFKGGRFDVVVGQWIGFNGPDMMKYVFHSKSLPSQAGNRTHYSNPEFDRLIDLATFEIDAQKRIEYYKKAEAVVNEDYAYIHLWHPNVIWIASHCLSDVDLDPSGVFYPLSNITKKAEGVCAKK